MQRKMVYLKNTKSSRKQQITQKNEAYLTSGTTKQGNSVTWRYWGNFQFCLEANIFQGTHTFSSVPCDTFHIFVNKCGFNSKYIYEKNLYNLKKKWYVSIHWVILVEQKSQMDFQETLSGDQDNEVVLVAL